MMIKVREKWSDCPSIECQGLEIELRYGNTWVKAFVAGEDNILEFDSTDEVKKIALERPEELVEMVETLMEIKEDREEEEDKFVSGIEEFFRFLAREEERIRKRRPPVDDDTLIRWKPETYEYEAEVCYPNYFSITKEEECEIEKLTAITEEEARKEQEYVRKLRRDFMAFLASLASIASVAL